MRSSISFVRLSRRVAALMLVLFVATVTYAQITPSSDAYTSTAKRTTNFGTAATLGVVSASQITYITFDLSSIPAGYTGTNVAKASLKLYVNAVTTEGSFNVDYVNGTWSESTITANLTPALGTTIAASVPLTKLSALDYVVIDITPAVEAWLNGTQINDGVALVANSPLSASFDSKENTAQSHPPELDIVFTSGGTITGITTASASGLMGGGTSGTLNLSLTNACAANQILQWNGTAWVCANLSAGGTVSSVGLTAPSTDFLVTGSPVTTSGTLGLAWITAPDFNNTPNAIVKRDSSGNFSAGTITAASGFNIGNYPFAGGSYANENAFLGFAGNATMTGRNNTATGYQALYSNTFGLFNTASGVGALGYNSTGSTNTASGSAALGNNTTGNNNTASGLNALYYNTTGSSNTALGVNAGPAPNSTNLQNATAIGAYATVSENNALVLGSINGVNGATASVNVGVGTTAPQYALDVNGTANFTGLVTFAANQQFPGSGSGTVTSVGSGAGLTGGPITSTGTLSIAAGGVTNSMLTNPSLTISPGTGLTGGGLVPLGGSTTLNLDTTQIPQLNYANTFTGNQTVNGNLSATGLVTGTAFNIGSNLFAFGSYANGNAFLGFAGNATTTGSDNTASGVTALFSNTTGTENTASGYDALYSNTTGYGNTASGYAALGNNTTGGNNTGSGTAALNSNTTGNFNTASGWGALLFNTTGYDNTAAGYQALYSNTMGINNTASGDGALYFNTTACCNTADGYQGLYSNTTGIANTGSGIGALYSNTTGSNNTAEGASALYSNTTGNGNTASGDNALGNNTTGSHNTALGFEANVGSGNLTNATAIGALASVTQSNSLVLGSINGVNGALSNTSVGIGTTAPSRIFTVGQGFGDAIADGWDTYSSGRWKTNIQTLRGALGKIQRLRGVSYDLKANGKHEVGVIAEEVGAVVPEVVTWEKNGKDAQGVDYSRLTALLIEATKEQQALIHQQQEQIQAQQAQMKVQEAQIARLSRQVKTIEATLQADGGRGSAVRAVKTEGMTVRQ